MTSYYENASITHEFFTNALHTYRFSTLFEIIYSSNGYFDLYTKESKIHIEKHSCIIIPPYMLFKITTDEFEGYRFSFNKSYLRTKFSKKASEELIGSLEDNIHHSILSKNEIKYIERMTDVSVSSYSFFDMARLLAYFQNTKYVQSDKSNSFDEIKGISEYINNNISQPLHIEDIADVFSTTPLHINRIFKRRLSVTPAVYIAEIRFINAVRLLLESSYSIDEICHMCGYLSRTHFQNVFKQRTGVTPRKIKTIDDISNIHYLSSNIN